MLFFLTSLILVIKTSLVGGWNNPEESKHIHTHARLSWNPNCTQSALYIPSFGKYMHTRAILFISESLTSHNKNYTPNMCAKRRSWRYLDTIYATYGYFLFQRISTFVTTSTQVDLQDIFICVVSNVWDRFIPSTFVITSQKHPILHTNAQTLTACISTIHIHHSSTTLYYTTSQYLARIVFHTQIRPCNLLALLLFSLYTSYLATKQSVSANRI
jgi:hypothetical protein